MALAHIIDMSEFRNQISLLLWIALFLMAPCGAYCLENRQVWDQFEVATATDGNNIAFAFAEKQDANVYESPKRCVFSFPGIGPTYHRNSQYTYSANPSMTFNPSLQRYYAICMSVMSDYSKGNLEVFSQNQSGGRISRIGEIIVTENGIPDKPVIRSTPDGKLLLGYTEIKKESEPSTGNPIGMKTTMKLFKIKGSGTIISEVSLADIEVNSSVGSQGLDMTHNQQHPIAVSFGEYFGKNIHLCFVQGNQCTGPVKIESPGIEVPITRIKRASNGGLALSVYDAHSFNTSEVFLLDSNGKIEHRMKLNNVALTTPFILNNKRLFFSIQKGLNGNELIIIDPERQTQCREGSGIDFSEGEYIGAYLDSTITSAGTKLTIVARTGNKQSIKTIDTLSLSCLDANAVEANDAPGIDTTR